MHQNIETYIITFSIVSMTGGYIKLTTCRHNFFSIFYLRKVLLVYSSKRPRHQGGAHGGRAPAKIVRAPAKISRLFMLKNRKRPNDNPVSMEAEADG